MRDVLAAVRTGARGFAWFVRGVLGEDAYDKYAAHHAATHGGAAGGEAGGEVGGEVGEPAMTEREFWRDQTDRQQQNPQGRCC